MNSLIWIIILVIFIARRASDDRKKGMDRTVPHRKTIPELMDTYLNDVKDEAEDMGGEVILQRSENRGTVYKEKTPAKTSTLFEKNPPTDAYTYESNTNQEMQAYGETGTQRSVSEDHIINLARNRQNAPVVTEESLLAGVDYTRAIIWSEILGKPKALQGNSCFNQQRNMRNYKKGTAS